MSAPTTADFLAFRFRHNGPDATTELRTFKPNGKVGPRSWHGNPATAAEAAATVPRNLNVFYGVTARLNEGGKKEHVTGIPGVWQDLDFKGYADGEVGAWAALDAFPLAPTTVTHTGGGLQATWEFVAPLTNRDQFAAFEELLSRHAALLGSDPAVAEVARVMRLPGSFNNKPEYGTPRPVTIARFNIGNLYTLADFEALLPAPVAPEHPAWSPPVGGAGRAAGYSDIPSIAELREIMRHIPPGGDYTADWLRFLGGVHSVYPGPEGVAICEEWCPGKPGEIAHKFASFKRDGRAADAASVGTLVYIAKQHGYEPPRRAQASAKFTMDATPQPVDDGQVLNVLAMAEALDTAQRMVAELELKLARCREEHLRKDATIESLDLELRAYKAAAAFPDQTMGGAAWDVANGAFAERERGNVLVEDGKEKARVCYQTAAHLRSCTTVGKATKKFAEAGAVAATFRKIEVETEAFKGTVDAAYLEIPPECDTPAKFVLHLLKTPVEKKHGGARRKVDLPEFDEPVAGPVKCVTEKRRLWSDLTTDKVVKVERIASHTEHFDADGYQMTAAEVDEFNISIGKKVREPAYRPAVQITLSPEDIDLTTIPRANLDDDPRRPVPLYAHCAQPGCALPALKGEPLCSRHTAVHGYSMTGAD